VYGLSQVRGICALGYTVWGWDDSKQKREKAKYHGAELVDLTKNDLSKAEILVLSPGVPYTFEPHDVVQNAQKFDLTILGDLELFFQLYPDQKTVGITGTNGKSTTTALMAHMFEQAGLKTMMAGNIGTPVFDVDPSQNYDVFVLEMSSYQLDLCPTFRPDYSVLLNITPDHLDRHGSMLNYIAAKEKILKGKGFATICVDDDFTQESFNKIFFNGQRKVIPFSIKSTLQEGFFVKDHALYHNHKGNDEAILSFEKIDTLKGLHNEQNMTACFIIGQQFELETQTILESFKSFSGLRHRQYKVAQKGSITFINDSKATNAEAAAKALGSYQNIFWIIGGRSKDGGLKGLEIFQKNIVKTYVIGEAAPLFSDWLSYYHFPHMVFQKLEEAVTQAIKDAEEFGKDCAVLLSPACASWAQYSPFENRGEHFEALIRSYYEGQS